MFKTIFKISIFSLLLSTCIQAKVDLLEWANCLT